MLTTGIRIGICKEESLKAECYAVMITQESIPEELAKFICQPDISNRITADSSCFKIVLQLLFLG